jgi:hypothetical protein
MPGTGTALAERRRELGQQAEELVRQARALAVRATDLSTTPARLTAWLVGLLAVGVLAMVVAATGASRRADAVDQVRTRTGPLTVQAQQLYRSLSDADATAAIAFLNGGVEPPALRAQYEADIAAAGSALARLGAGGDTGPSQLAELAQGLAVYTGLVEAARANNRIGAPLGAAYLREASSLMRDHLLPAAEGLYEQQTRALATDRSAGGGFPWVALPLLLLMMAGLLAAQRYLYRTTRRLINIGAAVATAAAGLAVIWLLLSSFLVWGHLKDANDAGSAQIQGLSQLRISALQARTDEALTLVARGNGAVYEADFSKKIQQMLAAGGELDQVRAGATDPARQQRIDEIRTLLTSWQNKHVALRQADDGGDYPAAVALAIATDQTTPAGRKSTATVFAALDRALSAGIEAASSDFDAAAADAAAAGSSTTAVLIVLLLIALGGVVVGLQQRLAEYR